MTKLLIILFISSNIFATTLLSDDFESDKDSLIYRHLIKHKLPVVILKNEGVNGSKGLKVTYVSSALGSERLTSRIPLNKEVVEATLSFDVKFDSDFQFVKGGKLHGVGPDNPVAGGDEMKPSSWSSRVMFRRKGRVSTYLYVQNKVKKYGEFQEGLKFKFTKNKYYKVSLYTKLNSSPNKANGEAHIYIDGRIIVRHIGLNFWKLNFQKSKITNFLFSTFHGGHDPSWAPKDKNGDFKNVSATFDNFLISTGLKI